MTHAKWVAYWAEQTVAVYTDRTRRMMFDWTEEREQLHGILQRVVNELTPHKAPPGADHTTIVDHIISMCRRALK